MGVEFVVDAGLAKNAKFRDLARRVAGHPNAYSVLLRLWAFAANFRPDGNLTGIEPSEIPLSATEWKALIDSRGTTSPVGFLEMTGDVVTIHDWTHSQRWVSASSARRQAGRIAGLASARVRREAQLRMWEEATAGEDVGGVAPARAKRAAGGAPLLQDIALQQWLDRGFLWFWSVYPKHEKRIEARKSWEKLHRALLVEGERAGITKALKETIARHIAGKLETGEWQATAERKRFIPDAPTYLNQRRWSDEKESEDGEEPNQA